MSIHLRRPTGRTNDASVLRPNCRVCLCIVRNDGTCSECEDTCMKINTVAEPEGWAIFNDREIQRDDEMDVFASDADAIDYVDQMARKGSLLHTSALAIHRRHAAR